MTNVVFASVMIAIVALVAVFGFSQSGANPAATACSQPVSSNAPSRMATVYRVSSTRAAICVLYKFEGAQKTNFTTVVQPWYQTSSSVSTSVQCSPTDCPMIDASPASAYHEAGAEVAVEYTIVSPANLTGLFIIFHGGCGPIILAFGPTPSSVYLTAWTCGPVILVSDGYRSESYNVTGVTNVDVLSVPWA